MLRLVLSESQRWQATQIISVAQFRLLREAGLTFCSSDQPPDEEPSTDGPQAQEMARILAAKAQATHEAIAALAGAQVALEAIRSSDSQEAIRKVGPAAQAYRHCEEIVQQRVAEEVAAQINLGIHRIKE